MKIAHIFWSFTVGGAETMLVEIMNRQSNENQKISLIIVNNNINQKLIKKIDTKVKIIFINRPSKSINPFYFIKLWYVLFINHYDVIHCHNSNLIRFLFGFRKKTVLTVHDVSFNPMYFKKYNKLFAISKAVKDYIKKETGLDSILIYNGINFNDILQKTNYSYEKFKIVQISRLDHNKKGQVIMIEAIDHLVKNMLINNIRLTFIGTGSSEKYLKQLVNEKNLNDYIEFKGERTKDEINHTLHEYNLLVQPSIWEGFGLTIIEAMAAKVPVLVSDVDGPIEIIKKGKYGHFFKSNNHLSCAIKIKEIIDNYYIITEKNRLDIIYKYALTNFDINKTTLKYLNYYCI